VEGVVEIMRERRELIPWWNTEFEAEEIKRVKEAMSNRLITQGSLTEELESRLANLLNIPYVVLTTSGSSALLMTLIAFGIKPGDEVIVPNFTFMATAQAPLLLGAKVKLVDIESDKPVMDIGKFEEAITSRTKAVIPVHLNGRAADIVSINKIAKRKNIIVIEDSVQALCSRNEKGFLGGQSNAGIFSLGVTKLITSGQGGFVATKDSDIFNKLRKIRNHGINPSYPFSAESSILGFNFKFNDILASIGLSQINKIEHKIKSLKNIYNLYKKGLKNLNYVQMINVDVENGELPLWIEVSCNEKDKLVRELRDRNIQSKPFYSPLNELPYLNMDGDYRNSKKFAGQGLVVPSGPDQDIKDLQYVIKEFGSIADRFY
jgi:dTDP-4-amino-4,6-dideoxygalactose transaminase